MTQVSVVVPTRNESDNLDALVARTVAALAHVPWTWELLVVDDSDDDTPDRVRAEHARSAGAVAAPATGRPRRRSRRCGERRLR